MSIVDCKMELQNFLAQKQNRVCQVVVMPDFFLDRIIDLEWDVTEFSRLVEGVAERKGGSLDGIEQMDMNGGNAINITSALSALGVCVTPIICTSEMGLQQLKYRFREFPLDLSHVKTLGKASVTTALEFRHKNEKANVMLRYLGALADFGPKDLSETDYKLIEDADYTCLFNWAGTLKFGTALAEAVLGHVKLGGKGKTFYDSADPNPNFKEIPALMERVLKTSSIDILSINENEALTYASFIDPDLKAKIGSLPFAELAMEAARILAKHFLARIDLHTSMFSATVRSNSEVFVPSFRVKVWRATGAGDAWNAGNILGDHNGLSDYSRLTLANAVSACYLSGEDGLHPTKQKLAAFLRDNAEF
jgi:sugar/nucleoside kinase (ribokinase family)